MIEYFERAVYAEDSIGLKTLDQKGKLKIISVSGVNHFMWHLDVAVCDNYIIPFLD